MARKLTVEIIGDSSSLERSLRQSGLAAQGFGSHLKTLGKVAVAAAGAAGIGALFVTLRAGISELTESSKVAAQTNAVLKSTGGIANVTAKEVDNLATALMNKSGVDDETIKSGENLLLTFVNIRNEVGQGNDIFTQATRAALDLSVAFGKDMSSSAILVGKALNDPIKGLTALTRVGVTFTQGQKDQIKALVASGKTLEAQKLILRELTKETGGSAAALGKTLPGQLNILRERFSNMAGEIVAKLIPSLKNILPAIGAILTTSASAISGAIGWFVKLGKEIGKEHTFTGKLKVVWTNIREVAVDLANKLADFFWRGWTETMVAGAGGGPGGVVFQRFHEGLLSQLKTVDWGAVGQGILDGIVEGLKDAARIATRLVQIVDETMSRIDWASLGAKLGPALVTAVGSAIVTALDPVFWAQHWELALSLALVAFGAGVGRFAIRASSELALAIGKLSPAAGAAMLTVIVKTIQVFDRLGPLISKAFGPVESLVRRLFGRLGAAAVFVVKVLGIQAVIQALQGLAVSAFNKAKTIGTRIIDGIKSGLATVYGAVKGKLDAIWRVITNVAGNAYSAAGAIGRALLRGIADGFTSGAQAVWNTIKSAAQAGWNWITSHVGSTPDQLSARTMGAPFARGIGDGFFKEWGGVQARITAATRNLAATTAAISASHWRKAGQNMGLAFSGGLSSAAELTANAKAFAQKQIDAAAAELVKLRGKLKAAADTALGGFEDAVNAWKSPTQKLIDKFALADQLKQLTADLADALVPDTTDAEGNLTKLIADPAAVQAKIAEIQRVVKSGNADAIQALRDQGDAVKAITDFYLGQQATAETTAYNNRVERLRTTLARLETQMENAKTPEAARRLFNRMMAIIKGFTDPGGEMEKAGGTGGGSLIAGLLTQFPNLEAAVTGKGGINDILSKIKQQLHVSIETPDPVELQRRVDEINRILGGINAPPSGEIPPNTTPPPAGGPPPPGNIPQPGSYQHGTSFVPRDMLAYLHKGEAVIPARDNRTVMPLSGGTRKVELHVHVGEGATFLGNDHRRVAEVLAGPISDALERRMRRNRGVRR